MKIATDEVFARLSAQFPDVAGQHISAVLTTEQQRLAPSPIQDFVPVLVERAAAARLPRSLTGQWQSMFARNQRHRMFVAPSG